MTESSNGEILTDVEFEVTDEAIDNFLGEGEGPSYHTILQVWREVLAPAKDQAGDRPTPQYCNKIISSYPHIGFADMIAFRDQFHTLILELEQVLLNEIDGDPVCLDHRTPEEDATLNAHHYKNVLLNWQMTVMLWEKDWDCENDDAAVTLAAIGEVYKMFFGPNGLTALLDNIPFEFTEADQETLAQALQELKDAE